MAEIRKAMGLLACDEPTGRRVPAYAALYSRSRSGALRQRFRTTFLSLYGLPAEPTLNTALAVGLSAFKLPFCAPSPLPPSQSVETYGSSDAVAGPSFAAPTVRLPSFSATVNSHPLAATAHHQHERSCPTCDVDLHALAQSLPASHHMTSVVVCRISGRVMDDSENGRPMCFPNGYVYSYGVRRCPFFAFCLLVCSSNPALTLAVPHLRRSGRWPTRTTGSSAARDRASSVISTTFGVSIFRDGTDRWAIISSPSTLFWLSMGTRLTQTAWIDRKTAHPKKSASPAEPTRAPNSLHLPALITQPESKSMMGRLFVKPLGPASSPRPHKKAEPEPGVANPFPLEPAVLLAPCLLVEPSRCVRPDGSLVSIGLRQQA